MSQVAILAEFACKYLRDIVRREEMNVHHITFATYIALSTGHTGIIKIPYSEQINNLFHGDIEVIYDNDGKGWVKVEAVKSFHCKAFASSQ